MRIKVGRNSPCPCGKLKKYKDCCEGKVDWKGLLRSGRDVTPYLSVRGRNLQFGLRLADALQLNSLDRTAGAKEYKEAFTPSAVRKIYEAVLDVWPTDTDIVSCLTGIDAEVSGLFVGLYRPEGIQRALVRHSIYANKILLADPFLYPAYMRDEYNPIENPEQYRVHTLKCTNLYFSILPWIQAGIVELIRTPEDFDIKLKLDAYKKQREKFEKNPELAKALDETVAGLTSQYGEEMTHEAMLLAMPDSGLRQQFRQIWPEGAAITEDEFIKHIHRERLNNPNFLAPLDETGGQMHIETSGAAYEIAKITANITGSYLVTDLKSRWKEIELDREKHGAQNGTWAPFAKAIQDSRLRYLDNVQLEHALTLRREGRLEGLRSFLHRVWRQACQEGPFAEQNAEILALELEDEVRKAENEWKAIGQDLIKISGTGAASGLMAAGPLIAAGYGGFVAAAAFIGAGTAIIHSGRKLRTFQERFPAGFFMGLDH